MNPLRTSLPSVSFTADVQDFCAEDLLTLIFGLPRYAEAIHALNAGRLADAKSLLNTLLTDYPQYYRGYSAFWDVIGRIENAEARRAAARRNLKPFE
jgi:hypothetical protein